MAESVDAADSKSAAARCTSSSLVPGTRIESLVWRCKKVAHGSDLQRFRQTLLDFSGVFGCQSTQTRLATSSGRGPFLRPVFGFCCVVSHIHFGQDFR